MSGASGCTILTLAAQVGALFVQFVKRVDVLSDWMHVANIATFPAIMHLLVWMYSCRQQAGQHTFEQAGCAAQAELPASTLSCFIIDRCSTSDAGGRRLNADLRKLAPLQGHGHLLLEVTFPTAYPEQPPFLRMLKPRCVQCVFRASNRHLTLFNQDVSRRGSCADMRSEQPAAFELPKHPSPRVC